MNLHFSLFFRTFFSRVLTLLIVMVFSQYYSYAQGNLQFNQVLTYSGTINCTNPVQQFRSCSGPVWIVPSNKVWKIEFKTRTPTGFLRFTINDYSLGDILIGNSITLDNSPIWLKSNDEIKFLLDGLFNGNISGNYFISILEYNIIP